jgi:hypothetical protein
MSLDRKPSALSGSSPDVIPETLPTLELKGDTPGSLALADYKLKLDVWWRDVRAVLARKFEELEN